MLIRILAIGLVAIIVLAICFKDPIYDWFTGTFKSDKNKSGEGKGEDE